MATAELLEFESLLSPIPGDVPTGVDLRADPSPTSPFENLRRARKETREAEKRLEVPDENSSGEPGAPNWGAVIDQAQVILREQSKDLEVAAFMIEALIREGGFAGLRDGFRLVRELVEKFWDGLHPMPDEAGVSTRVAAMSGLNASLVVPINNIPIAADQNGAPLTWFHYQQAAALEQVTDPEKKQRRIEGGAISMEMVMKAMAVTPADFIKDLVEDMSQCDAELTKYFNLMSAKCGKDAEGQPAAPPCYKIQAAVTECLAAVKFAAKDKLAAAEESSQAGGQATGAAGAPAAEYKSGGAIMNREAAFREILRIAAFFRQTEPQSLVPYALEQAVKWGQMPLPELLATFVPEEGSRNRFAWLGVKGPAEEQSS